MEGRITAVTGTIASYNRNDLVLRCFQLIRVQIKKIKNSTVRVGDSLSF